ncbi:putative SCAR/WAVE family protein [Helianthus annuus]|nr:putative SCAR/WAVE family protein [Helianthus annuus]KAJ0882828.1 putative SCAR/WAVE family protein [Helianthus annuus]
MPFSRYQIRNEFSLADPELYKAADKDDPEALLEGVAMAGLVGVLRQLGDLAEFAAEIFHGLHEEVMATAARGHGLLTRVQQVESDLPLIERAFLSQTGHSAFFSSSGISWHPNLQTEQNLITKGDLPRFVMDSYEECRGPPRLFLLDKFDVAGAGACLKRYTDPSFYKVEVPSYDMMNAEAQRDKKIRKIKKKGSRLKNGDTPEVFQPSHVKLHQLLLEERVQNGASEPARRVKIKKRDIKFPFDTETGKGYMEKLLSSPPEDKLVHEVKMVHSPLRLPTNSSEEPELETLEDKMVNLPPVDEIEEKHISVVEENKEDGNHGIEDVYQSDDVASETDNYMDALATMESEVETDVEFRAANSDPIVKQETVSDLNLEKIQKAQVSDSQSASDDVSSLMKSKITTFFHSDSDSESTTTSPNNMSPRVNSPHAFASTEIPFRPRVLHTQESDLSEMSSSNCVDVNIPTKGGEIENDPEDCIASRIDEDNNSDSTLVNSHVEEQSFGPSLDQLDICEDDDVKSKSDPAEARGSYSNEDETELKDKETVSVNSESENANVFVCDHDVAKIEDNHIITEDEKELDDRKPESSSSETKDSSPVSVPDVYENNEIKDLPANEEPREEDRLVINDLGIVHNSDESVEKESVISPELDSIPSAYYDHSHAQFVEDIHSNGSANDIDEPSIKSIESDEKKESNEESVISPELYSTPSNQILDDICDAHENEVDKLERESLESGDMKESSVESFISLESDSIPSAYHDHPNIQFHDNINKNGDEIDASNPEKESVESGEKKESSEESVIVPESDSIPSSAYDDHPNIQLLDGIDKNGNESDGDNPEKESIESCEKKESSVEPSESDSVPSAYHDHPNTHFPDSIHKNGNEHDNDNDNPSTESIESGQKKESSEESIIVPESDSIPSASYDHSNIHVVSPDADIQSNTPFLDHGLDSAESAEAQLSIDHDGQISKVEAASFISNHADSVESHNHVSQDPIEPSVVDILPPLPPLPINMEEMPPLPPLPPMHWMMGRSQNPSFMSIPGGGQADISHFPPVFPQIETHPTSNQNEISRNEISNQNEISRNEISEHDHEVNKVELAEEVVPQPPINREESRNDPISEPEIIRLPSTSSLPSGDGEMPNGIRPMKIQRPRTPLIDAVAAHDKNKLRKVTERATPLFPKEEEKDTFLEQIRAKSFNLKPAVPTRPIIQGPTTNLRVAAILEKANAIRQAFAGSDDDEDDDSWSDS